MATVLFIIYSLLLAVGTYAVDFSWPFWTFKSVDFQPPKLDIIRSDEAPSPGLLFIGPKNSHLKGVLPDGGSSATIYDQVGNLIWKGPNIETSNLQVQTLFGKPVLTYWSGTKINGYGYGAVHILDDSYKEIYTVKLKGEDYITPDGSVPNSFIDLHESQITERNTILVTSYNTTQIDTTHVGGHPDTWVLKSAFHEIDVATNEVLFSWSPLDHEDRVPLTASRTDSQNELRPRDNPWDTYHINSVQPAASGYIVSLRHTFSALYVDWEGSVVWQIDGETGGDFDLCETCRFSWQHHITAFNETPDGLTLTVFNNDGKEGPDKGFPTTGLVLGVDLTTMTVSHKRTLSDLNKHINADTQGSIQALDGTPTGNMLLGYGPWATIIEYNTQDQPIWTARFGPDAQIGSYRSFKFDWHATPWYPPRLSVNAYQSPTSRISTHFYVSWNGATDIVRWKFYAQSSLKADPVLLGSVPKTEFETMFITEGYLDRVSVEAVLVNGTTLPRTTIHRTQLHAYRGDGEWKMPYPDDPGEIVASDAPNSAPGPVLKDSAEVSSKLDPSTAADDAEPSSTTNPGLVIDSYANDLDGSNPETFFSQSSSMYEEHSWLEFFVSFFLFFSLASGSLMLIWICRRKRRLWTLV